MKKKLQLKKEVVSILSQDQMTKLTKGGASGDVCPQNCSIVATMACPTQHNQCLSDVCIEPITKKNCGGETGQCVSATTCDTDVCPILSAADVCTEKSVNMCLLTEKC